MFFQVHFPYRIENGFLKCWKRCRCEILPSCTEFLLNGARLYDGLVLLLWVVTLEKIGAIKINSRQNKVVELCWTLSLQVCQTQGMFQPESQSCPIKSCCSNCTLENTVSTCIYLTFFSIWKMWKGTSFLCLPEPFLDCCLAYVTAAEMTRFNIELLYSS